MQKNPVLHIALPAINEAEYLPATMQCLLQQSWKQLLVWVCVNQPDHWWQEPEKLPICQNNQATLEYLRGLNWPNLHILDHSSPGKGWPPGRAGVGMARRTLMEAINAQASPNDIIVSLDADTTFGPLYLESIVGQFNQYPRAVGLSNPYYHPLSGEPALDRAMLRYEIYMRHYAINMWDIGSPYSFTALGSAMAVPLWAYRRIGGITPKKSGEDFYFLQKLRKTGWLLNYNHRVVFPGTRFSQRVFFGTGPALIKGSQGNWDSYPVYDHKLFHRVKATYELFPALFTQSLPTAMSDFLQQQFGCNDIFEALRQNAKTPAQFIRACHHRIDGLRILQFLKSSQNLYPWFDEENLELFLRFFFSKRSASFLHFINNGLMKAELGDHPANDPLLSLLQDPAYRQGFLKQLCSLDFHSSPIEDLDFIRNLLCNIERIYQLMDLDNGSE